MSYRRADTRTISGRLYDRLEIAFGSENVFKDVDDIPLGHDFRQVLEREISKCDVLLAIIGREWASAADGQNHRRIDDEDDFVRIEIEAALRRDNVLVIPVLVEGATMPSPNDLPGTLREMAFRHAAILRDDPDFRRDVERLIAQIQAFVDQKHGAARPAAVAPQPDAASGVASQVNINSQVQTGTFTSGQIGRLAMMGISVLAVLAIALLVVIPRLSDGNGTRDGTGNGGEGEEQLAPIDVDGTLLFHSDMSGDNDIWMYELDTGELTNVIDFSSDDRYPAASPTGEEFAFISDRDGDTALFIYDFEAGEALNMVSEAIFDRPSWSPESEQIAFAANPHENAEIFILDVESGEVWSQEDDEGDDLSPSWNPQGTWIAFSSERHGYPQIFKLNIDAEDEIYQLSYGELVDTAPAYSPDGLTLAYSCGGGDHTSICLINDNGELDFALPADGFYHWPAWSPDGRFLAVNREEEDGSMSILLVEMETRETITLDLPSGYHHVAPTWLD